MKLPKFGLNRHDTSSITAYADDVRRAEECGWDAAFLPDSQLRRRDTYVLLYAAAQNTEKITIGPLLTNPVTRHPSVTASSIATVGELAPRRTILACGIGDTAVRLAGLKPATIKDLSEAVVMMRSLLSGDPVDVGAASPAVLPFPQDIPIWIAAGGPKTLKMAGSCADGVFIRVGADINNIQISVDQIRTGASEEGKDPHSIKLGIVFHTVFVEDEKLAVMIGKSMAAGYYEYSPMLMENLKLSWGGPDPHMIKEREGIWPDFHHSPDLIASGKSVDFLTEQQARSFCLLGNADSISAQIITILTQCDELGINFEYVVLQPIPNPPTPDVGSDSYLEKVPREIIAPVKASIG